MSFLGKIWDLLELDDAREMAAHAVIYLGFAIVMMAAIVMVVWVFSLAEKPESSPTTPPSAVQTQASDDAANRVGRELKESLLKTILYFEKRARDLEARIEQLERRRDELGALPDA